MPVANVVDRRKQGTEVLDVDAVFEPVMHSDYVERGHRYPASSANDRYLKVDSLYNTTVQKAIEHANERWRCKVTVYLYDVGSQPLHK
jgi:hypothetical protein